MDIDPVPPPSEHLLLSASIEFCGTLRLTYKLHFYAPLLDMRAGGYKLEPLISHWWSPALRHEANTGRADFVSNMARCAAVEGCPSRLCAGRRGRRRSLAILSRGRTSRKGTSQASGLVRRLLLAAFFTQSMSSHTVVGHGREQSADPPAGGGFRSFGKVTSRNGYFSA